MPIGISIMDFFTAILFAGTMGAAVSMVALALKRRDRV